MMDMAFTRILATVTSVPVACAVAIALLLCVSRPRMKSATPLRERDGPPRVPHFGWSLQRGEPPQPHRRAAELRLFAACVEAGLLPAAAAQAVAHTSELDQWAVVATLLSIGSDPLGAWEQMGQVEGFKDVSVLAKTSHHSGAALAQGLRRVADGLDNDAQAQATAAAQKASVLIAAPLSLCFLPAFIVLGLIPLVINLGLTMF